MELNTITQADIFELLAGLEPASVDMFLCDLPYGTTACAWDEIIPLAPMWAAIKRVMKPDAAIVLTASQPFTSKLVSSNFDMFRCEWVWIKAQGTNPFAAKLHPLKTHESILVFSMMEARYFPQMGKGRPYSGFKNERKSIGEAYGNAISVHAENNGTRYPTTLLYYAREFGEHPTQKPVALFEYLIRTYTRPGELVVDPCVGSGTTALAARNTGRNYICGDSSPDYVAIAQERLAAPYTLPLFILEGDIHAT